MKFLKKHKAYILIVYAFLLFIHFILKDNIYPLSILFYAFPLIILIVIGLIISLLYIKRKIIFTILILFQLFLTINWFLNYHSYTEYPSTNIYKTSSILFWNVAKNNKPPIEIIIKHIKEENISSFALVEAEYILPKEIKQFKEELPEYNFRKLKGNMIFGSVNQIKKNNYINEYKSYKFNYIETIKPNNKIEKILIVDIYANPFFNRKKPLSTTFNFIKENDIDIIIGDFNTPFESIHFSKYKSDLNGFHKLSKGFTATWAYGFPLLELDHVWTNKRHTPLNLKKINYSVSDHQLLIADYILK